MLKYLPFLVVGIFMVPLTVWQWDLMDWVWGDNLPALQCAYVLHKDVPMEFGDWVGEDQIVEEEIRTTAGADGYISRVYTNQRTQDQVSIWFIVGHFRQVARHTPNVCYRANGFEQIENISNYKFVVEGQPDAEFRTSKFMRDQDGLRRFQRVFWAWWRPDPLEEGESASDIRVAWSAPEEPRVGFGYCRALYKLYFTASTNESELPAESICNQFAKEFIPIVDETIRESCLVMVGEELPDDAKDYLPQLQKEEDKPEDNPTEENVKPADAAATEEETEEATSDE
ncbi:MAG: exosortase-associated EpsI family protein [Aeoliella sp.]